MKKANITIEYCPKCGWLLRSAWMAQELLTTFELEIDSVSLKPSETGGLFQISVDGDVIYDRKTAGGFPQPKELKQLIRDKIAPDKSLGHSEAK
ncbi:SelT/SelW/SelH family protein [Emticicia sp. CRIBPO]|uniref:SelT/SelW/SelH family protein n=1 Tax=Emticicia sp. CRIBPO TaxID=2683258 RepID=UPI001412EA68|nr:SelT/SelW/SelH family protein [Emticicia sp. CRIBPO]NBA84381.1 SelT/SelW/SelH family protein [Emticicia sp. CRIBPO]